MRLRRGALLATMLVLGGLVVTHGLAKGKGDKTLPEFVLTAKTVAVMVDPSADVDKEEPMANLIAQRDVQAALEKWGRFQPIAKPQDADLVIVIRKGHSETADATMSDARVNTAPAGANPAGSGGQLGAQRGIGSAETGTAMHPPQTGMEPEGMDDFFVVYQGGKANPPNGPAVWRSLERNGLHSHDVPAVGEFRKAVAAAEKAAAEKKQ